MPHIYFRPWLHKDDMTYCWPFGSFLTDKAKNCYESLVSKQSFGGGKEPVSVIYWCYISARRNFINILLIYMPSLTALVYCNLTAFSLNLPLSSFSLNAVMSFNCLCVCALLFWGEIHVICYIWHVTHGRGQTFSQNVSSIAFSGKEKKLF